MSQRSADSSQPRLVLPTESDIGSARVNIAHPNEVSPKLVNAFFIAADRADLKTVDLCLQAGVPINCLDMSGRTVFHIAAASGCVKLLDILLNWPGSNLNIRTLDFMCTPLHAAVINDREEIVERFLRAGANVNIPNGHGSTVVHLAVKSNSINILQMLIAYKANLNVLDIFSDTPLSLAILDVRDRPISSLLLRNGARVNKNRPHAMYLFHEATLNCLDIEHIWLLKLLVKYGAFVNYVDETGKNALHYAAIGGFATLIQYLLLLGVKPSVIDRTGRTPFDVALQHEHLEAVNVLTAFNIKHGTTSSTLNLLLNN